MEIVAQAASLWLVCVKRLRMAFEVPSHLPRHAFSGHEQSIASTSKHYDAILAKIQDAPLEKLDSSLASSWVHELSQEIESTKVSVCLYDALYQLINQPFRMPCA